MVNFVSFPQSVLAVNCLLNNIFFFFQDAVTNNHASPTSAVNLESLDGFPSSKSFATGVHSSINIDGFVSDLSYDDDDNTDIYSDDFMDDDEYAMLQAHFDNVDILSGVEAPIPWLPVSVRSKKSSSTANTSSQLYPEAGQTKKKPNPFATSTYSSLQTQMGTANHSTGLEQSTTLQFLGPTQRKKDANLCKWFS